MASTNVHGLRIAYEQVGSGSPLVLLHGILGDRRLWHAQLAALSDQFTVIAWDCPGCGESDDPPEDFLLPQFAHCLVGFVAALGIDRPHLVGMSWGAGLALEVYRQLPTLPRSLVLSGAYAGWAGSLAPREVERRLQQCLRESDLAPRDFIPGWLPGLLTESAPATVAAEVIEVMSGFHPIGYRTMARAFAAADLRDILPDITVPTLVLHGEADARAPLPVAHALRDAIPGSTLTVLPSVGHLSNLEAPALFNAEVRHFLTGVDQRNLGELDGLGPLI